MTKVTLKKLETHMLEMGFNYGNTSTTMCKGLNRRY
jgi:hypothetical protein